MNCIKKNFKMLLSNFIVAILVVILTCGITVYASGLMASSIDYTNIKTVATALDDLYNLKTATMQELIDNSISGLSGTTYSSTGERVETWIDGKPLYQKTVTVTSPATDSAWAPVHRLGTTCIIRDARAFITYTGRELPLPWRDQISIEYNSCGAANQREYGTVSLKVALSDYASKPVTLLLWYTKTTD